MGGGLQATSVPHSCRAIRQWLAANTPASALSATGHVDGTAGALGRSGGGGDPAAAAIADSRAVPASAGCFAGTADAAGIGDARHTSARASHSPGVGGIRKLRVRGARGSSDRAGARISTAAQTATCSLTAGAAANWPVFTTWHRPTTPGPLTRATNATTCKPASWAPAGWFRRAAAHTADITSTLTTATAALGAGERVSGYLGASQPQPRGGWPVSGAPADWPRRAATNTSAAAGTFTTAATSGQ